jgi:hypothetical protein
MSARAASMRLALVSPCRSSPGAAWLAPDLREAAALARTMALRLKALRGADLSLRRIADALNDEGLPSPGGGAWYPVNVQRALERVSQ